MARLGRPRKAMATRHACGKIKISAEELERRKQPRSIEDVDPTPETIARRTAAFGNPKAEKELCCPIDLLSAHLTEEQYYAGRFARTVYARYCIAIRAPRVTAGQLRDFVQGNGHSEPMDADAARAAVEAYQDTITAIRRYSFRSLKEVERVMHGSMPRSLDALAMGLTALADHMGLKERRAA